MELYLGAPFAHIQPNSNGYALSHEMIGDEIIEKYKALPNLILDNGADELGEGQGGLRLAYLAGRLQPKYLILPDVVHNDKLTRQKGEKFFQEFPGYPMKYIGVIQAKTLKKGIESYTWWAETGIADRIGITYDTMITGKYSKEYTWGNRISFLSELLPLYEKYGLGVHLLGTLDVEELYILHRYKGFTGVLEMIKSHDTTMPYACDTPFEVTKYNISLGRKKDYPRQNFKARLNGERLDTAEWNVASYLAACQVDPNRWIDYLGSSAVELFSSFEHFYG